LSLDRSQTIDEATRALNEYRGAPENFILADSSGRIAYHLAGLIPNDSAWGRYVHPARDLTEPLRTIPFADLPQQNATANGVVLSANNRMYGAHYDYRLSAAFEPPYRAYRIASLLRRRSAYDVSFFREMQLDTYSPIEAEIVDSALHIDRDDAMRDVAHSRQLLDHWDGRFDPDSRAASLAHDVTIGLEAQETSLALLLERLRAKQHSYDSADQIHTLLSAEQPQTWATHGAVEVVHPLSVMWYGLLQGHALPGDGDEFTIHLQSPGFAQGFRAVWSVGDWDAGGISIPSGESGEPSSGHYDDRAPAWIAGTLEPLPFSNNDRRAALEQMIEPGDAAGFSVCYCEAESAVPICCATSLKNWLLTRLNCAFASGPYLLSMSELTCVYTRCVRMCSSM
jgi:penicillin amidase